jgi:hypothetical protein
VLEEVVQNHAFHAMLSLKIFIFLENFAKNYVFRMKIKKIRDYSPLYHSWKNNKSYWSRKMIAGSFLYYFFQNFELI